MNLDRCNAICCTALVLTFGPLAWLGRKWDRLVQVVRS